VGQDAAKQVSTANGHAARVDEYALIVPNMRQAFLELGCEFLFQNSMCRLAGALQTVCGKEQARPAETARLH
jgi:hypothetical protein